MTQTPTQQERRAISALYRALHNQGETQYRALDRLQHLVSEAFAFEVWLSTKPDPRTVEQVMNARSRNLLSMSPLRPMISTSEVMDWSVALNRSTSQW